MSRNNPIVTGIVLILLGIFAFIMNAKDISGLTKERVQLNGETIPEELKPGTRVTIGVDAVIDWYAELEHTRYGVKTSRDLYCMVWLDDETFIGMKVSEKYESQIDGLIDAFWKYWDYETDSLPAPITYEGVIQKMEKEEQAYFVDMLKDMGYNDSELPSVARYVTINTEKSNGGTIFLLILGILFIVAGVFVLLLCAGVIGGAKAPKAAVGGYSSSSAGTGYQSSYGQDAGYQSPYGQNAGYQSPYGQPNAPADGGYSQPVEQKISFGNNAANADQKIPFGNSSASATDDTTSNGYYGPNDGQNY